jgi:hypothetical protein
MFEVGKKVVCIKRFYDPFGTCTMEVGQEFILQGIKKAPCGCHDVDLDVGIRIPKNWALYCELCSRSYPDSVDGILWFASKYFAPMDNEISDISLDELLEEIGVLEHEHC